MKSRFAALVVVLIIVSCCGSAEPTPDAVATQVAVMRAAAATLTAEATVLWMPPPTATPVPTDVPTRTPTLAVADTPTHTPTAEPSPTPPVATTGIPSPTAEPSPTPTVRAPTEVPSSTPRPTRAPTDPPTRAPSPSPTTFIPEVTGRIVFSAGGSLHVVYAATGADTITPVPDMRQPDFRADGNLIVAKGFQGPRTSLWTIDAHTGAFVREQGDFSDDFHPFWSPDGGRFVYDSLHQGFGNRTLYSQRLDTKIDEMLRYEGEAIIGMSPVWLVDDWIAFTGCDYWPGGSGGSNCGVYRMPSWSGRPFMVHAGSLTLRATDTYGSQLLIMSEESGDWEVYIKPEGGGLARNLTNGSGSREGLGTFSPDGKLAAFLSDRGGAWAVWAVKLDGSGLTRLFNLPADPTGTWTEESISWAP